MNSKKLALCSGLACVALALAACGSPAAPSGPADESPSQSGGAAAASQKVLTDADSPIVKFFGTARNGGGLSAEQQEQADGDAWREGQSFIAACMSEQGFEYTPRPYPEGGGYQAELDERDPVETAHMYGYFMTFMDSGDFDENGNELPVPPETTEFPDDPNWVRQQAMSDAEKVSYDLALNGSATDAAGNTIEAPHPSCYKKEHDDRAKKYAALEQVYATPEWAELDDQLSSLSGNPLSDDDQQPENVEITKKWADCMSTAGYPEFNYPTDPYDYLNELIDNTPDVREENGEWNGAVLKEKIRPLEIKIATADAQCKKDVDYEQTVLKLRFDRQQKFIDGNLPELEGFRLALIEAQPA